MHKLCTTRGEAGTHGTAGGVRKHSHVLDQNVRQRSQLALQPSQPMRPTSKPSRDSFTSLGVASR